GLYAFAQHCPRLYELTITFDATLAPRTLPSDETRTNQLCLKCLNLGYSPVGDPGPVAEFLFSIFPHLWAIRSEDKNTAVGAWLPVRTMFKELQSRLPTKSIAHNMIRQPKISPREYRRVEHVSVFGFRSHTVGRKIGRSHAARGSKHRGQKLSQKPRKHLAAKEKAPAQQGQSACQLPESYIDIENTKRADRQPKASRSRTKVKRSSALLVLDAESCLVFKNAGSQHNRVQMSYVSRYRSQELKSHWTARSSRVNGGKERGRRHGAKISHEAKTKNENNSSWASVKGKR
ncbi:hypothetical protein B0H13DRAFT_2486568, partial [Mycena leptocephala]